MIIKRQDSEGQSPGKRRGNRPSATQHRINVDTRPDSAGIDIGAEEIVVAIPPDRCPDNVRTFTSFTGDLARLRDWLLTHRNEVQWDPVGSINRVITDPHEAMAMVNTSISKAVGSATVPAGAGGTGIDVNIDMNGPGMGFDREHEAVFKWRCARTWEFYSKLWDELNLPGTKAP